MKNKKLLKYAGHAINGRSGKMTKEEIKNRFDNEVAYLYSQRKPVWLPEFEFAFSLMAEAIRPYLGSKAEIIDLGAGTGNLSRTILETYQNADITLVDFSPNMLKEVDNVLLKYKGRYKVVRGDLFKIEFEKGKYDCVISSFAIHHGRGLKTYQDLYKNIYGWLKKNGIFICCDVIEGATKHLDELDLQGWAAYLKDQGFKDTDIKRLLDNYKIEDSPISVAEHMSLLEKSGFKYIDILWKKYNFGLYLGIK